MSDTFPKPDTGSSFFKDAQESLKAGFKGLLTTALNPIDAGKYPATAQIAEWLDARILTDLQGDPEGAPDPVLYLGVEADRCVGIFGVAHSPAFKTMEELEAWLEPRKAIADLIADRQDGTTMLDYDLCEACHGKGSWPVPATRAIPYDGDADCEACGGKGFKAKAAATHSN